MMGTLWLKVALTAAVYFMVALTTCSTKECRLQLEEKLKNTNGFLTKTDIKLIQAACMEVSCRQSDGESKIIEKTGGSRGHQENLHKVLKPSCGSKVCNTTSVCLDMGCSKNCVEAPASCALHTASKNGNLSRVKFLLSQEQVDVNCQEWIGRTPVMWAATGGHREVFELLVSKGANVSLIDRFGINILHAACLGGDVEIVKYVLSQNILDIDSRLGCGRTSVMLAAENRHKDVLELLVVKGADILLVDKTGDNVLHCACRGGDVEEVRYILSRNMVDINSQGHHNKTPVIEAAVHRHNDVVQLLVRHGADLSISKQSGNNMFHIACYHGQFDIAKYVLSLNSVDIDRRGWNNRTPVMLAAIQGHNEVVELLVKHGADLSITETSGNNVLHLACQSGRFDVVKYLLSLNSVDINSRAMYKRTPMMLAAKQGHKKVVQLLVERGADLSLTGKSGSSVLHLACQLGRFDVVKYLLSLNSVDLNSRAMYKRTPMMLAAKQGHKKVVQLLVERGADLSLTGKSGSSVLHLACQLGRFDVVKYLLSLNSVDLNSRAMYKRTPMMLAAKQGHKKVVQLLVERGADLSLTGKSGSSVLHLACQLGRFDVVKYLLSLNSVDLNSSAKYKRTPIMLAANQGHKNVVELLVKHGADLVLTATSGNNVLHFACGRGHFDVVKYLLSLNRMDINSRGWKKMTPAMLAAEKGHKAVVELLLKNGASL